MTWYERAGGRKFVMGMTALAMGFVLNTVALVLAIYGKLTDDVTSVLGAFTAVLIAVFGFYSAGNVVATVAGLKAGASSEEVPSAKV